MSLDDSLDWPLCVRLRSYTGRAVLLFPRCCPVAPTAATLREGFSDERDTPAKHLELITADRRHRPQTRSLRARFLSPRCNVALLVIPFVSCCRSISYHAKEYSALLKKAVFVSGRDTTTVERFSDILNRSVNPAVWPGDVRLVRDPVLSDTTLTDNTGSCWKQSQGVFE